MLDQMFHFLVTYSEGSWDLADGRIGSEEFSRSRFLEYTQDDIVKTFERLTKNRIAQMKAMPCLCAYEGEHSLKIGKITHLDVSPSAVHVEIAFDKDMPPIDFKKFAPNKKLFGIHDWEFSRTHWAIKSGDLFEKLKQADLVGSTTSVLDFASQFFTDAPAGFIPEPAAPSAGSVTEFIDYVNQQANTGDEYFYRGHTDATYRLVPSLFRTHKNGLPLYRDSEHEMFREVLVSNSFDFQDDTSTLDRLVRMQHYSLPTRLLDITANPLIGLFFAVYSPQQSDEKLKKPGEVITFQLNRKSIKYFDSDTASCIANLALLSARDRELINAKLSIAPTIKVDEVSDFRQGFNNEESTKRLLHYIRGEKPYFEANINPLDLCSVICVKGKRTNDRITSQSGAFLLFGDETTFTEEGTPDIKIRRITITDKERILRELATLNINESTVFPNLENSCNSIKKKYQTPFPTMTPGSGQ